MQSKAQHENYAGFIEKFKPKRTTDDCFTPPAIYSAVLSYVHWRFHIGDAPVVRPFYPGGDYEAFDYPDGCVVIDNPPFSIYAKILQFYHARGIRFFLFAPALTMAGNSTDTAYYSGPVVTYTNGANVSTGFATNLDTENKFVIDPVLYRLVADANKRGRQTKKVKNLAFPKNITSSARLNALANHAVPLAIRKDECQLVQKCGGIRVFGGAYVLSDAAANRVEEARRQADEARRQADEARRQAVELSPQEAEIVRRLNEQKS